MRAPQGSASWVTIVLAAGGADGLQSAARQSSASLLIAPTWTSIRREAMAMAMGTDPENNYESTDAASKGIVSSLTALVNLFPSIGSSVAPSSNHKGLRSPAEVDRSPAARFGTATGPTTTTEDEVALAVRSSGAPPRTPQELLERIRCDYATHNYLWTGNLDLACFDAQCRFTDPTLSFTGTAQFVRNVQNLQPLVERWVGSCRSELLDIALLEEEGYVQTRWNMVGDLDGLPWKPRINIMGRTKFWFDRPQTNAAKTFRTAYNHKDALHPASDSCSDGCCYRVTYYDESWEVPAYKALLQLVTPAGMF